MPMFFVPVIYFSADSSTSTVTEVETRHSVLIYFCCSFIYSYIHIYILVTQPIITAGYARINERNDGRMSVL